MIVLLGICHSSFALSANILEQKAVPNKYAQLQPTSKLGVHPYRGANDWEYISENNINRVELLVLDITVWDDMV